jgi:hypothetical protein
VHTSSILRSRIRAFQWDGVGHTAFDGFFRAQPQVGNFVGCPSLVAKAGVVPQDRFNAVVVNNYTYQ